MTTTDTPKSTDGGAAAPAGGSAAGTADFDAILREYTEGTKSTDKPQADVGKVLTQLKPVIDYAQTELSERAHKATEEDVSKAVNFVKEQNDALKDLPDEVVRGMLHGYASDNDAFTKAFQNRGKDKAGWQAALAEANKAVSPILTKLVNPATKVVSDVAAARASVSGASSTPPPKADAPSPQQMFSMSERDFQALLAKG